MTPVNRIFLYLNTLVIALLLTRCSTSPQMKRDLDPWVIRINLDDRPRMVALALNPNLYAAYDASRGALYQVWKGDIEFTGPVFDNIHGRQPKSRGEAYIKEELKESPWSIRTGEQTTRTIPDYQGYTLNHEQITLHYQIQMPGGERIHIEEKPEFITLNGKPGFERVIITHGVPENTDILLDVSFRYLPSEQDLNVTGEWIKSNFSEQSHEWGSSYEYQGTLKLAVNGTTTISSYFDPKATAHVPSRSDRQDTSTAVVEEPVNLGVSQDLNAMADRGKEVLGSSDCAACHNVRKPLIGPSYEMIAQKYETTLEVVEQLSNKIINGGAGVWGTRAMSAHPAVSPQAAKAMAAYILSVVPEDQASRKPGVAVDFYETGKPLASLPEIVAGQNPNLSEVHKNIDFRSGNPDIGQDSDENFSGFTKDFVMHVNGFLNVEESGTYDLQFIANNGGKLELDGKKLFEGHFYEGTYVDDQEVYLTKGAHRLSIEFYHHLFDKYLILGWRKDKSQEYEPIPAEAFTHNPFDIKPTSPGIKELVRSSAPGFGASLEKVHPSFDLSPVRPPGFEPRVGDISFMEDGKLALCTWDGEVYVMDNVTSEDPQEVKVTKIADGLCEPLGIATVDGDIYVLQRWELTKLVDHDNDGITDEYKSVSDQWGTSADFHEWSFGLIYRNGYFYATLGIAQGRFHDEMHSDRGKALKISIEDGSHSFIAYGLKEPNGIGIGVDGEIFATDNEGEYVPICKLVHLPLDGYPFYGVKSALEDPKAAPKEKPPVIWFPQNEIGNSPSQPIIMHYGPYEGQMIHGEITHGGIKRDFVEKVKGQYQGAVFRFSQGLEVGINRLEWGPDGALYACGLGGAQDFGHKGHQFGLERLTYNGNVAIEMLAIRAKANGLEIEFTKPLRVGDGIDPKDYQVQQWYYSWTGEGSSQAKKDLENLEVLSVTLSEDRTRAFLELSGMKPEHVLYVQLQPTFLSEDNDQLWSNEGWYTLNQLPEETGSVQPVVYSMKDNQLTPPEIEVGWNLLYDGRSQSGWQAVGNSWNHKDAQLQSSGGTSALFTDQIYDNFELEMEWKVEPDAEGGILFNIIDASNLERALATSPRMQLIDDTKEEAKSIHTHKSGANYDIAAPEFVVTKPTNQYNHLRLVVRDGQVEHWINGIKVLGYQLGAEEWKVMVQESAYATTEDYGMAAEGRIGLYSKNGKIWFKNIRLREIP